MTLRPLALALCAAISLAAPKALGAQNRSLDDLVLASVNGEQITRRQLVARLVEYRGEDSLDRMINRAILFQEAKRLGLAVTDAEVEAKLAELQRKFKSDTDYRTFLERSRLTEKQLGEEFRNTVLLQKVALKEEPLKDSELEQYDVSILMAPDRPTAEKWIKDLEKADFYQLASSRNTDPALKRAGGRLKPFLSIEMLDVTKAINEQKLKPKTYTRTPVQLGKEWGIIRLERVIPVAEAGLERDRLTAAMISYRVDQWVTRARSKAKVEKKPLSEAVVAVVNGEPLARKQLVARLLEFHGQEALEQMVNRTLLLQSAKAAGVAVTDAEAEKKFQEIRSKYKEPEAFQAFLVRSNLTEKHLRDEARYTALMEKVALKESPITEADLQRYEVRLIVAPDLIAAENWVKELNDGADFAAMALERSADPAGRQSAGSIRPFLKIEMLDLWRAIDSQKLKPGTYTKQPVLLTDNSWILLKLENILPVGNASEAEKQRLRDTVARYRVEQWLSQARANAKFGYPTAVSAVIQERG
jgi:hypothetical protein